MRQYIYDALCRLSDRTRKKGTPWSDLPYLDRLLDFLYFRGWGD